MDGIVKLRVELGVLGVSERVLFYEQTLSDLLTLERLTSRAS